jgi:aconitate hydratase
VTLRDLFAAAALLKAKRVPPRLDLLLAIPSRQMLETLSAAGALTDLLAAGARLVEPDARIMEGVLYPPPRALGSEGLSARTCDPEPRVPGVQPTPFVVASAETLSYAVATGEIGDPRSFKRPVRVTVPRALPTDDVLVVRERRAADAGVKKVGASSEPSAPSAPTSWKGAQTLDVVDATSFLTALASATSATNGKGRPRVAVVCDTLDEVRTVGSRVAFDASHVGAVLAPFIPSGLVALLSGLGVAALEIDAAAAKALGEGKLAKSIGLPAPSEWSERQTTSITAGSAKLPLTWLALGVERAWAIAGTAAPPPRDTTKPARR